MSDCEMTKDICCNCKWSSSVTGEYLMKCGHFQTLHGSPLYVKRTHSCFEYEPDAIKQSLEDGKL